MFTHVQTVDTWNCTEKSYLLKETELYGYLVFPGCMLGLTPSECLAQFLSYWLSMARQSDFEAVAFPSIDDNCH